MSCSEKKLEANRANAQLSTGPITAEGKAASRRNAIKHGMTAEIIAVEGEDAEALEVERQAWVKELAPNGHIASRLADRAFRAFVRLQRCDLAHDAHLSARTRRAESVWETQRAADVQSAIVQLETAPSIAVARLRSTAEGCSWLILAWQALEHSVEQLLWDTDDYDRAINLLGIEQVGHKDLFRMTQPFAQLAILRRTMQEKEVHPLASIDTTRSKLGERFAADLAHAREQVARQAPVLGAFIADQISVLEDLEADLAPRSESERGLALPLALFDPSQEAQLLHRYVRESESTLHRNLKAAQDAEKDAQAHGYRRTEPYIMTRPAPAPLYAPAPAPPPAPRPQAVSAPTGASPAPVAAPVPAQSPAPASSRNEPTEGFRTSDGTSTKGADSAARVAPLPPEPAPNPIAAPAIRAV